MIIRLATINGQMTRNVKMTKHEAATLQNSVNLLMACSGVLPATKEYDCLPNAIAALKMSIAILKKDSFIEPV